MRTRSTHGFPTSASASSLSVTRSRSIPSPSSAARCASSIRPPPEVLADLEAAERDEPDDVRADIIGIYTAWCTDTVDLERYSDAMRDALSPDSIAALGRSLASLGEPHFIFKGKQQNGEGVTYRYRIETAKGAIMMTTTFAASGLVAGLLFSPAG